MSKILGIESSSLVASVEILDGDTITAEYTVNHKKTHSQTLLPMLDEICNMTELDLSTIDAIAVSGGPGSFTGLRIGSATAKGLGLALDKPLISIPTTAAIAYNIWDTDKFVCPIMDARRNQVYAGLYCYTDHHLDTIWEQDALSIEALAEGLNCLDHEVIFLGDGVAVYREKLEALLTIPFSFAPAHVNRQRAAAVGALAEVYYEEGKIQTAEEHEPEYLRKSQAERERAERESVKHADVVKKQENGEKSE